MSDYLVLEDLLVERLRDKLPDLKAILTATDLADVQAQRLTQPAAHVIYLGDEVDQGAGNQSGSGIAQAVTQQWMVVLVVKFAGAISNGKGNRRIAGPLITQLLQALSGWQPNAPLTPLKRINAPKVGYENGFAYYPFAFKTTYLTIGKR